VRSLSRNAFMVTALCCAALVLGCNSSEDSEHTQLGERSGGSITIRGDRAPCSLVVVPNGTRIPRIGDDDAPDVGLAIARDSRGYYYTSSLAGGTYHVWDPAGVLVRSVGRSGSGPGELGSGQFQIYVTSDDSIHVRDGRAWSVFDSAGSFIRRMSPQHMGAARKVTHFVASDRVLTTSSVARGQSEGYFHVSSTKGELVATFGQLSPKHLSQFRQNALHRVSAYAGDSTFWVAPPDNEPMYRLERWSLDGELLQTVTRDVEWFRSTGPEADVRPSLHGLHVDGDGLLYAYLTVPNSSFHRRGSQGLPTPEMIDFYYDVIDPRSETLLASGRTDGRELPFRFFGVSNEGAVLRESETGLLSWEIASVLLRGNGEDTHCHSTTR
jgi:hypothetical protein